MYAAHVPKHILTSLNFVIDYETDTRQKATKW